MQTYILNCLKIVFIYYKSYSVNRQTTIRKFFTLRTSIRNSSIIRTLFYDFFHANFVFKFLFDACIFLIVLRLHLQSSAVFGLLRSIYKESRKLMIRSFQLLCRPVFHFHWWYLIFNYLFPVVSRPQHLNYLGCLQAKFCG